MKLGIAIALLAPIAPAQINPRYEVMRRLRSFEKDWIQLSDVEHRTRALPAFVAAAEAFSDGDLPSCAERLDSARQMLWYASPFVPFDAFARTPAHRLCERRDPELRLRVERFYGAHMHYPFLQITGAFDSSGIRCLDGELVGEAGGFDSTRDFVISTQHAFQSDDTLELSLLDEDFPRAQSRQLLSFVERRDERLSALKVGIDAAREKGPRLEVDSAEMLRGLLESLASGSTEAHDYPGARLLAEAEQVVAAAAKGERWYGPQRDGEFWLALPIGATSVRTRVFVPSGLSKEKPATLVIALHGRSFDEDTWFDGYGGGQSVELARKRGWMLAAPHCDGNEDAAKLAAITAALADVYPIDMSRVLLVGHSRGGGSALNAVAQAPDRFRAVATIGSALEPARASSLDKRPLFLAAGDHDFARESVETLHKALVASGATNATFKLYPNTEHWLCVTDALPDVFTWFDAQLRDGSGDLRAK